MKKFQYRLEPLLKIKSHVEKQRQKEHAAALMQVYRQQEALAEIETLRQQTLQRQAGRLSGRVSSVELQMAARYFGKLKRDTLTGKELLRGLETEAERRRVKLTEATKEKKIFEKLKERQQQKYTNELNLNERKELDEIAGNGFIYRRHR
jgi:flagellar FliJ protein